VKQRADPEAVERSAISEEKDIDAAIVREKTGFLERGLFILHSDLLAPKTNGSP